MFYDETIEKEMRVDASALNLNSLSRSLRKKDFMRIFIIVGYQPSYCEQIRVRIRGVHCDGFRVERSGFATEYNHG